MTSVTKVIRVLLELAAIMDCISGAPSIDDCTPLFFTPAWAECFREKLQLQLHESMPVIIPPQQPQFYNFQPMPNMFPPNGQSFAAFSSSSSSSAGAGATSVMSSNGRTWTVQSDGLGISSSSSGTQRFVKVYIDQPKTLRKTIEESENKLKVELEYDDGTTRWITVKLDGTPTKASDLKVERRENIMYIEGPL